MPEPIFPRSEISRIAHQIKDEDPDAWYHCHVLGDPKRLNYMIKVGKKCFSESNGSVSGNWSNGNKNKMSADGISFLAANGNYYFIDIIIGAKDRLDSPEPTLSVHSVGEEALLRDGAGNYIGRDGFIELNEFPPYFGGDGLADTTLLGHSLFWGLGGYKKYRQQLTENLSHIKHDLGADYVRWFFTVGTFDGGIGQDPFSDIGAFYNWSNHLQLCYGMMNLLKSFGLKSQLTLVGAFGQADTQTKRDAIVDRAAVLIKDYIDDFVVVEMWNEYKVNHAERAWLRNMARRLQSQLPAGFPIGLSSPDSVMGGHASTQEVLAEIEAMYGGDSGANTLIIHNTRPEPIWRAETLRQIGIIMAIVEGEPRGPGASAGGDIIDHNVLGNDYLSAIRARAKTYTAHSMPGIWGGHCDPRWDFQNKWKNVWEVTNWNNIADNFKSIRETGEPIGGEMPLPNRGEVFQFLQWLDWFYTAQEGLQREAGLVFLRRNDEGIIVGANADLEGVAAWGYDVYIAQRTSGKSHEEAQEEVRRQIENSGEWKSKHP